jgi:hypothetical protein
MILRLIAAGLLMCIWCVEVLVFAECWLVDVNVTTSRCGDVLKRW